jgi:outer membrane cobalamin receptor
VNHYAANGGGFVQADKKIKLLTISLGARYEVFKMDDDYDKSEPVFRTGLNYQLAKATFIRSSFGQGFRYPAIAEKYIATSVGSLNIFPNDTLRPEKGWSAEFGIKQGVKISSWYGYIDVALFWTQYHDMIEFTFGEYIPDSITTPELQDYFDYTGFKAYNISNAQINGIDVTIMGQGKFFGLSSTLLLGYTYTNPIDLDVNRDSLKSTADNILKYRYYHAIKGDFEVEFKKVAIGVSMDYHSFMINIDKAFEDPILFNGHPLIYANGDTLFFLPGLKQYRNKHHTGDIVFDARISYQVTETSKLSLIVKNVGNKEYMVRPGDIQAPRSIALQYALKF